MNNCCSTAVRLFETILTVTCGIRLDRLRYEYARNIIPGTFFTLLRRPMLCFFYEICGTKQQCLRRVDPYFAINGRVGPAARCTQMYISYLGKFGEVRRKDERYHDDDPHTSEEEQDIGVHHDELDQAVELPHREYS